MGILVSRRLASLGWLVLDVLRDQLEFRSESPPAGSQKASRASPESDVDGADSSHCLLLEYITCRHGLLLLVNTCNVLSSLTVKIIRLVGQSNYSSFSQDTL